MLPRTAVVHFPVRAPAGVPAAIMPRAPIGRPRPAFRTRARRPQPLRGPVPRARRGAPRHGVGDSRGVHVAGAGAWTVRPHGGRPRRTGRPIDSGGDDATQARVAHGVTARASAECAARPTVLAQVADSRTPVRAAGRADPAGCERTRLARGAQALLPPRATAVGTAGSVWAARTAPRARRGASGRAAGQVAANEQRRRLAAPAGFRLTTIWLFRNCRKHPLTV